MEGSLNLPPPQNLTGRVSVVDPRSKFTGNYSAVYLGSLDGIYVAIKAIKSTGEEHSVRRKLLREITVWASTHHPHIQPFYGYVTDQWFGAFGGLVSPWCSNGDASQYLRQNSGRMVTADRVNLWGGVLEGVAYLHRHKPVIIHGDLKPGNILIDDHGVPKICDFGLARILHEGESMGMTTTSEHTGTERYLAPELVISEENVHPTMASDAYALGCLGLEFIYDQKPYAHRANNLRGRIIVDIRRQIPPATSPPHRSWAVNHFWPLIQQLWSIDPRYRPSALDAVFRLRIATRDLPSNVLQLIIRFSSITAQGNVPKEEWDKRTSNLYSLCLVSSSFRAWTTPLLYGDIFLTCMGSVSPFSQLRYTLGHTATNKLPYSATSTGYGSYTKRFRLCLAIPLYLHLLPELRDVMLMMSGLRYVEISTAPIMRVADSGLSTLDLNYIDMSCIMPNLSFLHAMPYLERLLIQDCSMKRDADEIESQMRYGVLVLPKLQEIEVIDGVGNDLSDLCRAVTHWVMPNLRILKFNALLGLESSYAAFTGLLRAHGSSLWHLKLGRHDWQTPPLMQALSLCKNLRSFTFQSNSYIHLPSFPVHVTVEKLELITYSYEEEPTEYACMMIVEDFILRWQEYFPNLRRLEISWWLNGSEWFSTAFRSEEDSYTVTNHETGEYNRRSIASADISDTGYMFAAGLVSML